MVERVGFFREDTVQGREEVAESRQNRRGLGDPRTHRRSCRKPRAAPTLCARLRVSGDVTPWPLSHDPSFLAAHRLSQVQSPQKNG